MWFSFWCGWKKAAEKAVRDCMTSVTSFPQLSVRVPWKGSFNYFTMASITALWGNRYILRRKIHWLIHVPFSLEATMTMIRLRRLWAASQWEASWTRIEASLKTTVVTLLQWCNREVSVTMSAMVEKVGGWISDKSRQSPWALTIEELTTLHIIVQLYCRNQPSKSYVRLDFTFIFLLLTRSYA